MKTVKEPPVSDVTPKSVPDPDLEIKGGGGGATQTLGKGGGARGPKFPFRPSGPQFGLKIRGTSPKN